MRGGLFGRRLVVPERERQDSADHGDGLSGERGEFKVEGSLKGDQVEFIVNYTGDDAPRRIPFQGKVEGSGKMSGRYNLSDVSGDWSAAKAK